MIVGGDKCPKGRELESQCRILDGSHFTFICFLELVLTFEKTENICKRGWDWAILNKLVIAAEDPPLRREHVMGSV